MHACVHKFAHTCTMHASTHTELAWGVYTHSYRICYNKIRHIFNKWHIMKQTIQENNDAYYVHVCYTELFSGEKSWNSFAPNLRKCCSLIITRCTSQCPSILKASITFDWQKSFFTTIQQVSLRAEMAQMTPGRKNNSMMLYIPIFRNFTYTNDPKKQHQERMLLTGRKRACNSIRNSQEQCRKNYEKIFIFLLQTVTSVLITWRDACNHHLN